MLESKEETTRQKSTAKPSVGMPEAGEHVTRLVKTVTGKPVNRFLTSNWFSEHIISIIVTRPRQCRRRSSTITWAHSCECIPTLCHECRNSSVVGSFWTSVLATVRLSTRAVNVCCPNIWTVLLLVFLNGNK